jgi:hypothetical protein
VPCECDEKAEAAGKKYPLKLTAHKLFGLLLDFTLEPDGGEAVVHMTGTSLVLVEHLDSRLD